MDNDNISNKDRQHALSKIFDKTFYNIWIYIASLGAAAITLVNTNPEIFPPGISTFVSSLGVEMIGGLIDRIASGENIDAVEINRQVIEAINNSHIAEYLTRNEFREGMAKLAGGTSLRVVKRAIEDSQQKLAQQYETLQVDLGNEFDKLYRLLNVKNDHFYGISNGPSQTLDVRIFLASVEDVSDEHAIALTVLHDLMSDPFLQGKFRLEIVTWDKPNLAIPMLANIPPLEAIAQRLPKPSECDIVILLLWSRMGKPLSYPEYAKPNGSPYLSSVEWIFWDAHRAAQHTGKPLLVVYHRTEEPHIGLRDPEIDEKTRQFRQVENFFNDFINSDGSIKRGYNQYSKSNEFRNNFESHIKVLLHSLLNFSNGRIKYFTNPRTLDSDRWIGSPFPGLRAFTTIDAPIFFGRGRETDALIKKLEENSFVAVIGASGSGKSSLVGAGLIPRLKHNAILGSKDWLLPWYTDQWDGIRFTPGEKENNPFLPLADKLKSLVGGSSIEIANELEKKPSIIAKIIDDILSNHQPWAKILFFIDQFEEIFTVTQERHRERFVDLLVQISTHQRTRTIITMRSDFYHRCIDLPVLAHLLENSSFPLSIPTDTLLEMIVRPADRAGLLFEEGLPGRFLHDMGRDPGALALMAYALDELYNICLGEGILSIKAYEDLQGVQGAIGTRSDRVFNELRIKDKEFLLQRVFRELVEVDNEGIATRRRASKELLVSDPNMADLIEQFTKARLLVTDTTGDRPVVEVAHEAMLRSWPWLFNWIQSTVQDLRLLRYIQNAALEWDKSSRKREYLAPILGERGQEVQRMLHRQVPILNAIEKEFTKAEEWHLLTELEDPKTLHKRRALIGDRLAELGDPRVGVGLEKNGNPDIKWCDVPPGHISISQKKDNKWYEFDIKPFKISKYQITYIQYNAFLEANDGYRIDKWWEGLARTQNTKRSHSQDYEIANHPVVNVSWYEAIAYCRWLSYRLGMKVNLPTEWQWLLAATGGAKQPYPWSDIFDSNKTNTKESGLNRLVAVGLYPYDKSLYCGAVDFCGNVMEWCLNARDDNRSFDYVSEVEELQRSNKGGTWSLDMDKASLMRNGRNNAAFYCNHLGFRICIA